MKGSVGDVLLAEESVVVRLVATGGCWWLLLVGSVEKFAVGCFVEPVSLAARTQVVLRDSRWMERLRKPVEPKMRSRWPVQKVSRAKDSHTLDKPDLGEHSRDCSSHRSPHFTIVCSC